MMHETQSINTNKAHKISHKTALFMHILSALIFFITQKLYHSFHFDIIIIIIMIFSVNLIIIAQKSVSANYL